MKTLTKKGILIADIITNIIAICLILWAIELASGDSSISAIGLIQKFGIGIVVGATALTSIAYWFGASIRKQES